MTREPNGYSSSWFEFFHAGIPDARTEREVAFLRRVCPLPDYRRVLDVCCGMGRHARKLAAAGYEVTGVERDAAAVTGARRQGGGPVYVQADIRAFVPEPGAFDAVILMAQSFGYFDEPTNVGLLRRLATALRPGGRLVLDGWNPAFFANRQGEHTITLSGGSVRERKRVVEGRLLVELTYPDGTQEVFDWQLPAPADVARWAGEAGMRLLTSFADYEREGEEGEAHAKRQFVLGKPRASQPRSAGEGQSAGTRLP